MTVVTNVILPILAGIAILATFYFGIRAFIDKSRVSREAYGVGQQQARLSMQVNLVRTVGSLLLSLVLLGVTGLGFQLPAATIEPGVTEEVTVTLTVTVELNAMETATLTILTPTATAVITSPIVASPTTALLPSSPTPLPVEDTPTPLPISSPENTPDVSTQTATVNSEVGVWLRAAPSTEAEQLEWLLDGTPLILLPGQEVAGGFEWQQVRSEVGNEGWVAIPFIAYNE